MRPATRRCDSASAPLPKTETKFRHPGRAGNFFRLCSKFDLGNTPFSALKSFAGHFTSLHCGVTLSLSTLTNIIDQVTLGGSLSQTRRAPFGPLFPFTNSSSRPTVKEPTHQLDNFSRHTLKLLPSIKTSLLFLLEPLNRQKVDKFSTHPRTVHQFPGRTPLPSETRAARTRWSASLICTQSPVAPQVIPS